LGLDFRCCFGFGEALVVVVDCGEGAEEEAADVGEDGSATGGDASLREEGVEGPRE